MTDDLARVAELNTDFEILRELGRGGTAVVYLARQREPKRLVAIKVIRPSHIGDEESAARMLREARLVAGLQHPNIVVLYSTRRLQDGSLVLIMQYVAGRTLKREVQENGALTLERAEAVLVDLGRGLAHAHGQRIVHRDIKPENVYVEDGTLIARLADFGIARTWDADSGLTMPGTALGTPAYMSPEQIEGAALDGRSDLYSLGVVGWEILTGQRPWAGESLFSIVYKQKHEDLPSLTQLRPGISPRLLRAVEGALRKDPAERWSSAEEFIAVLSGYSVRSRFQADINGSRTTTPATTASAAREAQPVDAQGVEPDANRVVERDEDRTVKLDREKERSVRWDAPTPGDPDATQAMPPRSMPAEDPDATQVITPRGVPIVTDPDATQAITPRGVPIPGQQQRAPADPNSAGVDRTAAPGGPEPAAAQPPSDSETEEQAAAGRKSGSRGALPAVLAASGLLLLMAAVWLRLNGPFSNRASGADGVEAASEAALSDSTVRTLPAVAFALMGGLQQGAAGQRLPDPLVVRVEDASGKPVAGAAVRFAVTAGTGQIDPVEAITDSTGLATARWTLGGAGAQVAQATVQNMDGPPLEFQATVGRPNPRARSTPAGSGTPAATPRRVARVSAVSATTVEGTAGAATSAPLMVRVTDSSGRGVGGVRVNFAARPGEGRVTPSAVTNADGTASAEWVLGNASAQEVIARVDGSATPIVFRATTRPATFAVRRDITAGGAHTCAIRGEGIAHCWGGNDYGQVGDGSTARRLSPVRIATPERIAGLAAGSEHSCGIGVSGAVYCWGNNAAGQLGDGTRTPRLKPVRVATQQRLQQIAVGLAHSCALDSGGRLFCWGHNARGQLGDASRTDREAPVRIGGTRTFRSVALGWRHSCALANDGSAYCWGSNGNGEIGDGKTSERLEPTLVTGGHRFVQLSAGSAHTCGVRSDGAVLCWGRNQNGQLGNGSLENSAVPVPAQSNDASFSFVTVGSEHSCALTRSGVARCWGLNANGQLGDGTTGTRAVPTQVEGEFRFAGISASTTHTCAVTVSGDGYCWGFNLNGQLGDGSRNNQARPIPVTR